MWGSVGVWGRGGMKCVQTNLVAAAKSSAEIQPGSRLWSRMAQLQLRLQLRPPPKCPTRTRSECVMASKQHKARSWSRRELTFETVIRGEMWRQVVVFPPREEGSSGGAAPAGCAGFAGGGGD